MKIAITGKMCSGKSTIANMICMLDSHYKIYSFAQKIKEIAHDLFNMKYKDRQLLIQISNSMKDINSNVWINYLLDKIKHENHLDHCIIDDLRFQNELDALDKQWIIISLGVTKEDQQKRLQNLYPDSYEEHVQCQNDVSEKNRLDFKDKHVVHLNTSQLSSCQLKHELYLLLIKHKS